MRGLLLLLVSLFSCLQPFAQAEPKRATIAFGSCIDDPQSPVWDRMAARAPSAVLLLGDTVYLEDPEWDQFDTVWARYKRLITYEPFARLRSNVPVYAVWDDHDFGPNDSDATFPHAKLTKRAFRKAFRNNPKSPAGMEGFSTFSLEIGPIEILALDSRSARVYPEHYGRERAMLGEKQLSWLIERLTSTRQKIVIIASPNQILPAGKSDELLGSYPKEYARLREALSSMRAIPIIISGDRHYAEVLSMQIGRRTVFEVSSSPLTAEPRALFKVAPGSARAAPPRTLHGELLGVNNFGLIDVSIEGSAADVVFSLVPVEENVPAQSTAFRYYVSP